MTLLPNLQNQAEVNSSQHISKRFRIFRVLLLNYQQLYSACKQPTQVIKVRTNFDQLSMFYLYEYKEPNFQHLDEYKPIIFYELWEN